MTQARQIGVRAFREDMTRYLAEVRDGAEFTIVSRGKPVAELKPPAKSTRRPPPVFGLGKGKMWIADNFDDEDPEINRMFYGDA